MRWRGPRSRGKGETLARSGTQRRRWVFDGTSRPNISVRVTYAAGKAKAEGEGEGKVVRATRSCFRGFLPLGKKNIANGEGGKLENQEIRRSQKPTLSIDSNKAGTNNCSSFQESFYRPGTGPLFHLGRSKRSKRELTLRDTMFALEDSKNREIRPFLPLRAKRGGTARVKEKKEINKDIFRAAPGW